MNSNVKDFEDGIQYFIAINNSVDTILTRNVSDFKNVNINVFTPKDFLNLKRIKELIESSSNEEY